MNPLAAMVRRTRIECAIARHWPDIAAVCRDAGVDAVAVHTVVDYLEALEAQPRHVHDCLKHPRGSVGCFDEHACRCADCAEAARLRVQQLRGRADQAKQAAKLRVQLLAQRIGVTGGRNYADTDAIVRALSQLPATATLVHGAAPGADTLCAAWWRDQRRAVESHPANWGVYGKAAGPLRNQEMVDSGLDLLIAFPGGRGTADMVDRAQQASIPILRPTEAS